METAKQEIRANLKSAIKELFGIEVEPEIARPGNEKFGDYSSNIAMVLIKELKKSPFEIAESIGEKLRIQSSKVRSFEKVEVIKPGFINFWLSKELLLSSVQTFLKAEQIPLRQGFAGQKVMVEFAHPNPLKEFHIGHLRNITIGESIVRLIEALGAEVFRANYQGDIGLHVAKTIWGLNGKVLEELGKKPLEERIKVLGEAYAKGSAEYEKNEEAKSKIQEINKSLYSEEEKYKKVWKDTVGWSMEYFDTTYKRLGSYFDRLFLESEVYRKGKEIVEKNLGSVFKKDDGAIIFEGEKFNLHNRVFVTGEGFATYEGKEMGLAFLEYNTFPFDLNIHVVAHEQAGYFKVVFKALELIDPKFKGKQFHLSYGMVELKEGKMSSRRGNVISGNWLIDEAKSKLKSKFAEMDEETLEKVAVGAVKYSMLKFSPASNISFSFDESISLEGNSGPYIQYTFARTQSVLGKAQNTNHELRVMNYALEVEEESLLRTLYKFNEVVIEAGENYAPNLLCNYLFDLSQKFNLFYQKHSILKGENQDFRLLLTETTGKVLKQGLNLLGIESPEKM